MFLGFTFICGKTRQGKFLLCRKTRRDRMMAKLLEVKEELRRRMHQTIPQQGAWLRQIMTGFFNYHAVPTNSAALSAFRYHTTVLRLRALRRRSQRDRMTWARMAKIAADGSRNRAFFIHGLANGLPSKTQRREPCAGIPLARICAGCSVMGVPTANPQVTRCSASGRR